MGKRKLDDQDVPRESGDSQSAIPPTFEGLALDSRLLQAIANEKYSNPTPVQAKAIPLALEGRDILGEPTFLNHLCILLMTSARAKTGSGKTAAYVLPVLQTILKRKSKSSKARSTNALILVPTRELASQVTKVISRFTAFCARDVQAIDLTPQMSDAAQRALLSQKPDIVVATPSRASAHLNSATLDPANLTHLVIDEADLVLSYEYGDDFDNIVKFLPQGVQSFLASATLTTDVDTLKGLFCRDPAVLDLEDEEKQSTSINQYVVKCAEDEKFLLIFALFKLKLVKGKCIVFVADVDRCYRVKLYLEQFGIKACVLNSELPVNCRIHVVEEFNKGIYDIIIATDDTSVATDLAASPGTSKQNVAGGTEAKPEVSPGDQDDIYTIEPAAGGREEASEAPHKKRRKHSKRDLAYGISRGIDFHNVTCVLNFDLPSNPKSYTHRIGRTARAGRTGIALSFVIPGSQYKKHKQTSHPCTVNDELVLASIISAQAKKEQKVQPYHFDMAKLEGFRYRATSALKAVGAGAVQEARLRELRQELLKSERLKRHLQENPADERWLRHDTELRPAKVQPHMRHVPDYLLPGGGTNGVAQAGEEIGFVGLQKQSENRLRRARERNKFRSKGKRGAGGKKNDPLKSFNAKGRQR